MKEIIIYTSQSCPHCKTAKDYLNQLGIPYIERQADRDPSAQREMQALGAMGVPTLKVNGQVMVGFNPQELQRLLKRQILHCPTCQKALKIPADKGKLKVTCPECQHSFLTD